MSSETTRLADLIIPEIFDRYVTEDYVTKLNILNGGAVTTSSVLNAFLAGAGASVNLPLWRDCTNGDDNVGSDDPSQLIETKKLLTRDIIVPRMVRTNAWSNANLNEILIAEDPVAEIIRQETMFRSKSVQKQILAVLKGVFANNATAEDAYHKQGDMRLDLSTANAGVYSAGVTNFTDGALIDAVSTMGDHQDELGLLIVHSRVYANMKKQNLIDTIQPSEIGASPISMYGNYRILVNDEMPNANGVYSSYVIGADQLRLGTAPVANPISFDRQELAGNGMGTTNIITRWQNAIAPNGISFIGTVATGGPSNASTTNNLSSATSWRRVVDRKNVKMVELVTREYAV